MGLEARLLRRYLPVPVVRGVVVVGGSGWGVGGWGGGHVRWWQEFAVLLAAASGKGWGEQLHATAGRQGMEPGVCQPRARSCGSSCVAVITAASQRHCR
jgi:hypothetical protein